MPYVFLALAICAEITATTLLKSSEGYTRLLPTVFSLLAYLSCHCSFSRVLFGERVSPVGNVGMALILVGCIVMNLFGSR